MKTKKIVQVEEPVVQVVAAKPLSKPVVKKPKPEVPVKDIKVTKEIEAPKEVKASKEVKAPKIVKAVKETKAVKQAVVVKAPKPAKKPQVVRDSFTMPENEYVKISEIKVKGLKLGLQVKKSEVLRAGLKALFSMDEAQLKAALVGLDKIKTGRPNKH
jgi:hypothetical protein